MLNDLEQIEKIAKILISSLKIIVIMLLVLLIGVVLLSFPTLLLKRLQELVWDFSKMGQQFLCHSSFDPNSIIDIESLTKKMNAIWNRENIMHRLLKVVIISTYAILMQLGTPRTFNIKARSNKQKSDDNRRHDSFEYAKNNCNSFENAKTNCRSFENAKFETDSFQNAKTNNKHDRFSNTKEYYYRETQRALLQFQRNRFLHFSFSYCEPYEDSYLTAAKKPLKSKPSYQRQYCSKLKTLNKYSRKLWNLDNSIRSLSKNISDAFITCQTFCSHFNTSRTRIVKNSEFTTFIDEIRLKEGHIFLSTSEKFRRVKPVLCYEHGTAQPFIY